MSIDRLYSLRELSAVSGLSIEYLKDSVQRGDLAAFRRTARGRIYIRESAFAAFQEQHTTTVQPTPIVVQLNPPKTAPKREPVDVSQYVAPRFKHLLTGSVS